MKEVPYTILPRYVHVTMASKSTMIAFFLIAIGPIGAVRQSERLNSPPWGTS